MTNGNISDFGSVSCEEEDALFDAQLFTLNILHPSTRSPPQLVPFDLHYLLKRKERQAQCELRALNLSIDGRPHTRIEMTHGVCDRKGTIRVDPPPPAGAHTLELAALGAAGAPLDVARLAFTHLGHSPADDPDALCLLSYSQSGNHMLRFIVEYLTARPTAGCRGNLADRPIHANAFPPPHRPLDHVDAWAPPSAYKFHYSGPAAVNHKPTCPLSLGELGSCRRLVLLVRDFGKCIPRYFEGVSDAAAAVKGPPSVEAIDVQTDLYLDNLRTFAAFPGPRLLVRYEDLVANHSAAAAVAAFLAAAAGPTEEGAIRRRAAALAADYEGLLALSRGAAGRSWMGVRRASSSYLRGWSNVHICHLAGRLEAALRPDADGGGGGAVVREALTGYRGTLELLKTACSFV